MQAFAESHPDVYGGVWFEGSHMNVGLTVMRPHAAALRALLHDPGSVTIRPVRFTAVETAAIRAELGDLVRGSGTTWHSLGELQQVATADLGADGAELARELHRRSGDRIRLTVGGRAYPPDGAKVPAQAAPVATREISGLQLRATLHSERIATGQSFDGTVHLVNTGPESIRFDTDQPLLAALVNSTGRVAGTFTGFTAGTGFPVDLTPGASQEIRFVGGTAGGSGDEYSTPPVPVRSRPFGELATPPVPLEVTPSTREASL